MGGRHGCDVRFHRAEPAAPGKLLATHDAPRWTSPVGDKFFGDKFVCHCNPSSGGTRRSNEDFLVTNQLALQLSSAVLFTAAPQTESLTVRLRK